MGEITMLKKIFILLNVILYLFTSIASAQVFKNKEYGFSVTVPDHWRSESKETSFVFESNEEKDRTIGIFFLPPFLSARSTVEDFFILFEVVQRFEKGTKATVAEPARLIKVAGQPAVQATFAITRMDGTPTKVVTAVFWDNDKLCQIICLAKEEEYGDALPAFKEALNSFKFNSPTAFEWGDKGFAYRKTKEYDKAVEAFAKAKRLDPKHTEYVYQLAYTYAEMGKYDQAIQEITQAIELKPKNAAYYNERAYAYIQKKDGQAALADINRAIELDPKEGHFYAGRGNAQALLGKYEDAIQDFEKQVELNGETAEVSFNLGQCHELLGNREEALKYYNKTAEYLAASPKPANFLDISKASKAKVAKRTSGDWDSAKEWL